MLPGRNRLCIFLEFLLGIFRHNIYMQSSMDLVGGEFGQDEVEWSPG